MALRLRSGIVGLWLVMSLAGACTAPATPTAMPQPMASPTRKPTTPMAGSPAGLPAVLAAASRTPTSSPTGTATGTPTVAAPTPSPTVTAMPPAPTATPCRPVVAVERQAVPASLRTGDGVPSSPQRVLDELARFSGQPVALALIYGGSPRANPQAGNSTARSFGASLREKMPETFGPETVMDYHHDLNAPAGSVYVHLYIVNASCP